MAPEYGCWVDGLAAEGSDAGEGLLRGEAVVPGLSIVCAGEVHVRQGSGIRVGFHPC